MLNISPFTYGLAVQKVYDSGTVFDPAILDITEADLRSKFMAGVARVAAVSLAIKYPTVASVPHSLVNGLKNCMALAAVTEITFKEAEKLKEFLGTPYYIAPEIIKSQRYGSKCDIWSLGVLVFQLISGEFPFNGKTKTELFRNICSGRFTFKSKIWD